MAVSAPVRIATVTRQWYVVVLLGGGTAATLDIVYAILRNGQRGRTPLWVLQSVASGWLGADAFTGGQYAGLLGLASHFAILCVVAAIYWSASRRFPVFIARPISSGLIFGVLVYLFMNFVVLPLSAFPYQLSYPPLRLLEGFVSHGVLVGLPIALAARWASPAAGSIVPQSAGQRSVDPAQ